MVNPDLNTWHPGPRDLTDSGIVKLMQALGASSYDDMLTLSNREPTRYWEVVMKHCEITWDRSPQRYVDLSGGPEFPKWFPGGALNWVNSVLAWGGRASISGQKAIVAEREDGTTDSLTYTELEVRVREFAAGLATLGIGRGDRVGLLMENGIEATVSVLSIAYLGAVVVPLFSGFGVDAIMARLSAAEATLAISTTGFYRRGKFVPVEYAVREAWARLPTLRKVIWKRTANETLTDSRDSDWQALLARGKDVALSPAIVTPDHPFMIIYTSGTTGKPKGVVHTHGSFPIKIAHDAVVHFDVHPGDVFCWPADMGWIAGTLVLSCALLRGATLVCYDGAPDFPDWSRMSRLIERHRITQFGSAPTLIRGMASNETIALQGDRSTLRLLITAGEGIDPEHFNWFQQVFGQRLSPLINYTGGTEASGALLSSVLVRPIAPSGFNTISPGVDLDVVDSAGQSVVDCVGELVVRQPFVGMTQSLWQDDERYLETYWRTIPGIWVHGDLAIRRSDGNFFMMGRSDDTIKVAGKRLGPAEIEEIVLELDAVSEAAAIGVNDAEKGQKLVIFVVLTESGHNDSTQLAPRITQHVDKRMGRPFRPSAVHVVSQLPKTRSSKIMRRVIRSVYSNLPSGDLSSMDNPAALDDIRAAAQVA